MENPGIERMGIITDSSSTPQKKDDVFLLTLLPLHPEGWSDGSAFAQGKLKALWVFYLATPL